MEDTVPEELRRFFAENPRPALAFSGGTDSAYLLYAALKCGADVKAYCVKSQFQPRSETAYAAETAEILGCDLRVLEMDILSDAGISSNPPDRCYRCKLSLFGAIKRAAAEDGRNTVVDATNASDDPAKRPGMKALEEMGILSPLRMCQMSKSDIRELSRRAGLRTWDLPSDSCLATRIPAGTPLTAENLLRTEEAERRARMLGLSDFRIRTRGDSAYVEIRDSQMDLLREIRPELERMLSEYYEGKTEYGRKEPST